MLSGKQLAVYRLRKSAVTGFAALAFLALALSVQAQQNLVTNGSFEQTTNGPGQLGYNTDVTDWTTNGYNFVFAYGTGDTTGSNGQYGNVSFWGPNNGSNNGFPAGSPDGGNFLGLDGAFDVGPLSQTINGLTVGDNYTVNFWWAGAQQFGFNGATTEQLEVSLGSESFYTVVLQNPSHGFTGWQYQSFTFTAANTSEALSFLAIGTPSGVPPFSLLDGVSLYAASTVPEPGTLAMMMGGLGTLGFFRSKKWFKR